jgi:hypothetical protein
LNSPAEDIRSATKRALVWQDDPRARDMISNLIAQNHDGSLNAIFSALRYRNEKISPELIRALRELIGHKDAGADISRTP